MRTKEIKEEVKRLYSKLTNKSAFTDKVAPQVERSANTIYRHWFSESSKSPGLPNDITILRILRRELKKELRKKVAHGAH